MTTPTLLRAAELLEREAEALRQCHTIGGMWARAEYDEMIEVARALRQEADEIERLRAVINDNVPKLITVARMPNQEHVADAHNRAIDALLKVTR